MILRQIMYFNVKLVLNLRQILYINLRQIKFIVRQILPSNLRQLDIDFTSIYVVLRQIGVQFT